MFHLISQKDHLTHMDPRASMDQSLNILPNVSSLKAKVLSSFVKLTNMDYMEP